MDFSFYIAPEGGFFSLNTGQLDNTKKEILEVLEEKKGIVSAACGSIGLARSTFYYWLDNDSDFKAAVDEIQEVAIDYVESKLFERIEGVRLAGNGKDEREQELNAYRVPPSDTAIIFYLKTKAKKRGYIERTEVTGADGKPMQVETKNVVEFRNYAGNNQGDNTGVQSPLLTSIRN